ncbi:MAG: hypothetical protein K940chlam9_01266 [Chlamydiae bacterium]|nr:hypothetical protein [Chlamydiota bacterium]
MSDISGITGMNRLTSKPKVSMEAAELSKPVEASVEMKELKDIEGELAELQQGIAMMQEIRTSLEHTLKEL